MLLTLDIDTKSNKAKAFVDFIKTLDFIKFYEDNDIEDFTLSDEQIKILDERKQKHIKGISKSYSWNELKDELIDSSR